MVPMVPLVQHVQPRPVGTRSSGEPFCCWIRRCVDTIPPSAKAALVIRSPIWCKNIFLKTFHTFLLFSSKQKETFNSEAFTHPVGPSVVECLSLNVTCFRNLPPPHLHPAGLHHLVAAPPHYHRHCPPHRQSSCCWWVLWNWLWPCCCGSVGVGSHWASSLVVPGSSGGIPGVLSHETWWAEVVGTWRGCWEGEKANQVNSHALSSEENLREENQGQATARVNIDTILLSTQNVWSISDLSHLAWPDWSSLPSFYSL